MERYVLAFSSSLERIRNYVPITKLQLKKVLLVWVIGVGGGGLSQVGCPFLGGLRSEWMKSGHGGSQKRPKIGGRPLYKPPYIFCTLYPAGLHYPMQSSQASNAY